MAGRKTFASGEVLTASDVNGYLMDQAVMRFADSAARGSAIAAPTQGMVTYLDDVDSMQVYTGSAWRQVANAYAIAAARGTVTGLSMGTSDSIQALATINWPVGRFTVPPVVFTQTSGTAAGSYKAIISAEGVGTATAPLYLANANISTTITALVFDVLGVQMTAGSAVG